MRYFVILFFMVLMLLFSFNLRAVASCQSNAKHCNDAEICSLAREIVNGTLKWKTTALGLFNKHGREARRRGLTCKSTCTNLLDCSLEQGFNSLSLDQRKNIQKVINVPTDGKWGRNTRIALKNYLNHSTMIKQATWLKKKLEKIATLGGGSNNNTSFSTHAYSEIKAMSKNKICSGATRMYGGQLNWETVPAYLKYVKEAKRRGLTCNIKIANTTVPKTKDCSDYPALCTVAQLCSKASHYSGGKKTWRKDYNSKKYVTEAKKNGVSCGVKVVVKKEKPVDNKTYKVASGTGFYVSNSGHIITNYHVIDGCKDMKVISQGRAIDTLVLANDPLNDLALLKAKENSKTYFSINNKQPEELQDVIVAGFPFGDKISSSIKFTQGIVSSLTGIGDNYSQIQIDAALQPGNSGGPIMDNMGNVIGVAVAKLSLKKIMDRYGVIPENTNFGIKASAVRNLMVGNSIIVKDPSNDDITKSELVKLAKEGTVHLTCWMTLAQIEKAIKDETGKVLFKEFQK